MSEITLECTDCYFETTVTPDEEPSDVSRNHGRETGHVVSFSLE